MAAVALVGTLDTKGPDFAFLTGRGSLAGLMPYGDANAIVVGMAGEVLPVVRDTPVLAGVCGTDPFRLMPGFLDELASIGFTGVQNFPTVCLIDGVFRQNLEETGMSFAAEVEMIQLAAEHGHLTCPYVFDPIRPSRWPGPPPTPCQITSKP